MALRHVLSSLTLEQAIAARIVHARILPAHTEREAGRGPSSGGGGALQLRHPLA
jgi:hypothetical protein